MQIYYWTWRFPSSSQCQDAASDAISREWLLKGPWYQYIQVDSQWEFWMARRPTTNGGDAQVLQYPT